jgi:hypothetical protein
MVDPLVAFRMKFGSLKGVNFHGIHLVIGPDMLVEQRYAVQRVLLDTL